MASAIFALGAVLSTLSGAAAPAASCRDGCYRLGLAFDAASAGGDLDGKTVLGSDTFVVAVPDLGTGKGVAAVAGVRAGKVLGLELRYERAWYRATIAGGEHRGAVLQVFQVGIKYFTEAVSFAQPFVKVGWIPFAQLDVERAGATAAGVGDGHLRRLSSAWDLGGGLEVPLGGPLLVELAAGWRFLRFDQARAPHMSWASYSHGLKANGWHAQLGVAVEL